MSVVVLSSGSLSFFRRQSFLCGQASGPCSNHSGTCHHSLDSESSLGLTPREARSARFVSVGTYLQFFAGILVNVSSTQLLTYELSLPGGMCNQHRTIMLSDQANTSCSPTSRDSLTTSSSLLSTWAPQSSRQGVVLVGEMGATLDLEITKLTETIVSSYSVLTYTTPP